MVVKAQLQLRDFWIRYKRVGWGICTGVVRASNLLKAQELGRKFCESEPNRVFLSVEDPVLVTEESEEISTGQ